MLHSHYSSLVASNFDATQQGVHTILRLDLTTVIICLSMLLSLFLVLVFFFSVGGGVL